MITAIANLPQRAVDGMTVSLKNYARWLSSKANDMELAFL